MNNLVKYPKFRLLVSLLLFGLWGAVLTGCASTKEIMSTDADPLESYNRAVFKFNDTIDDYAVKPVAKGYVKVIPQMIRNRVTDFFSNFNDVTVFVNDILQFKFHQAAMDSGRIVANTIFGLGGLFDVATYLKLPKHDEDFGQTLGYWGIGEGYFLVLPFLGPSTTRDVWGKAGDFATDPTTYASLVRWDNTAALFALDGLNLLNLRANLLPLQEAFAGSQIDPYSFQRQAYLQHRRNLVYDGHPPQPDFELDGFDDMDDPPPDDTK